jgi:hypothetical protein
MLRATSNLAVMAIPAIRVLALAAALALVAGGAGPVAAAGYDDLDRALLPRGPEEPLRLAVPGSSPQLGGWLLPYFSLGSHGLLDDPGEEPSRAPRYHSRADPSLRLDMGAGLSLRLFDRLHLYGEYRFFQSRPAGGSLEGPRRESDGPALRGGFAIPF